MHSSRMHTTCTLSVSHGIRREGGSVQLPLEADPPDADPVGADPLDADPHRGRPTGGKPPWCRPPYRQTPLYTDPPSWMKTPVP